VDKIKVIQTLYSGLGGHANVAFSLLESDFGNWFNNIVVFYGIEDTLIDYQNKVDQLELTNYSIKKKPKQYLQALNQFYHILEKEQPDRIIIHNSELILTAIKYRNKFKKCKVIYVEHQENHTKPFIGRFLSKYALKRADSVVCLNENYKQELTDKYTVKTNLKIISNGINAEKYLPSELGNSVVTIGMASRLVDSKEHLTLLDAFSKVLTLNPNLKLKIAGIGELEDSIKSHTKQLGISDSVIFLGLLDEDSMLNFYQTIDLYVHATVAETLSTSILQAMSCGLPIITSNISNNLVLIDHETGLLYQTGNAEDLHSKIELVIAQYPQVKKLGENAREKVVSNFSNAIMAENYRNLLMS